MNIYLAVPLFTRNDEELKRRIDAVFGWWDGEGLTTLQRDFGASEANLLCLSPGDQVELQQDAHHSIKVSFPKGEAGRPSLVRKGLLIRLHLLATLDHVDRRGASARNDTYFVMIDGSGAFDFANVFTVCRELITTLPRADVVLGLRPEGSTGMAAWRRRVEQFEEYLLTTVLGPELRAAGFERLPDSQAGCWGLCLRAMRSLPLTAGHYEIEYDLLASALQQGLRLRYTDPLMMAARSVSEYGSEVNSETVRTSVRKLDFISHKLELSGPDLVSHLEEFIAGGKNERAAPLPNEYVEAVRREFALPFRPGARTKEGLT